MEINDETKEIINTTFKGAFPKKGQYFYVTHKGNDKSWSDDVFKCIGTDPILVIATSPTDKVITPSFRFNRKEWNFNPVSEDVLNAIGICIASEDVIEAEIVADKERQDAK